MGVLDLTMGADPVRELREGIIGRDMRIEGPWGSRRLVYMDYSASGRALAQVEDLIRDRVLPWYGNPHTEISAIGARMNRLRAEARAIVAAETGAGPESAVIFTGSGATSGLNRLVRLFGADRLHGWRGRPAVVLTGPYEHHSNILPWREAGAETVEIGEANAGGIDIAELRDALRRYSGRHIIGSFSAASNVTGITCDVVLVTRILKQHGALAVWDYAGGGAYLPIRMKPAVGAEIDALVLSPHKLPGGPGASGVLVLRRDAVKTPKPSQPGGGSVAYVSGWGQDYFGDVVLREEAGSPNTLGDIRAALALAAKGAVGTDTILRRGQDAISRAFAKWDSCERLQILGHPTAPRLPIVSFLIHDAAGGVVHHRLVTRMLSDVYGIQAREGCSCAGPYGHRLLSVDRTTSERIRKAIRLGRILEKPGWTRINFCHLLDSGTIDYVVEAIRDLSNIAPLLASEYSLCPKTGNVTHSSAHRAQSIERNAA